MHAPTRDRLGICQWFHFRDYDTLERCVALLHELGVRHVRTGVSWADFHREGGRDWVDLQMEALSDFDVLLSVWHTPPSLAENGRCNGPPRRLRDYADFVDLLLNRYGERIESLELWNEPNNRYKWDFVDSDPDWSKFTEMIGDAAYWAKQCGKRTVLGGMIPVDHHWLDIVRRGGALRYLDVVAIHGFPGMWWEDQPNWDWYSHWQGWPERIAYIRGHAERPIWITETGLATCRPDGGADRCEMQVERLVEAANAPAERVYWYSLMDLDPSREAIEGFHVDEHEYHLGLVTFEGRRKPAFQRFRELIRG